MLVEVIVILHLRRYPFPKVAAVDIAVIAVCMIVSRVAPTGGTAGGRIPVNEPLEGHLGAWRGGRVSGTAA